MLGIEGSTFTSDTGIDRGTYDGKSLILDGSADYLTQTFGTFDGVAGNATWHIRFKRSAIGASQYLMNCGATNAAGGIFVGGSDYLLYLGTHNSPGSNHYFKSQGYTFKDTHRWHDVVIQLSTTDNGGTSYTNGSTWYCLMWVDGVAVNVVSSPLGTPTGGIRTFQSAQTIGKLHQAASTYWNGYISDFHFLDGVKQSASAFGEESTDTGRWVQKVYTGSYGTNGFHLDFNDDRSTTPDTTSTIYDQSGNSNNWTGNSLVAGSFTSDTPVDNFPTLNVLDPKLNGTVTENNLTLTTGATTWAWKKATMPLPKSGTQKIYYEAVLGTTTSSSIGEWLGLVEADFDSLNSLENNGGYGIYYDNRRVLIGLAVQDVNSIITAAAGDTLQIAVDIGNLCLWLGKDDVWYDSTFGTTGDPTDGGTTATFTFTEAELKAGLFPAIGGYSASLKLNMGATAFTATKPVGYITNSSANLTVPDTLYRKPQNFADILLYTGDGVAIGSGGNSVTGADFTPDFVWAKNRTVARAHQWFDVVRGATEALFSDQTTVETTIAEGLNSFDDGGFTTGSHPSVNENTEDFWSMCLKADNTSGSSNTDGSITSTVAAGEFFSIVTYTRTAAVDTFGHGLGKTPDLILIKQRNGTFGWIVYHSSNTSAPETDYLQLNTTAATADLNTIFNDTAPTSSVFTLGTNTTANTSGGTYVAYCFVFDTTDAASPFTGGSFESNGNTSSDGAFIPSDELLMLCTKSIDSTSNWQLFDQVRNTYNPVDTHIAPNATSTEATLGTTAKIDLVSNGSKVVMTSAVDPNVAETYIWWGIKKDGGQLWA